MNTAFGVASHALTRQSVQNDRLELTFLPGAGGRLLSLRFDGTELLWINPRVIDDNFSIITPRESWPVIDGTFASWTNIGGSKSWPAPQGWGSEAEWAGPPDPVLDAGKWSFASRYDHAGAQTLVTMQSDPDPRTGLQIIREFTVPDDGSDFSQRIVFSNRTTKTIRWAMWEVCQIDTSSAQNLNVSEAAIEVDLVGAEPPLDLGHYYGAAQPIVTETAAVIPIHEAVAKFGFSTATGAVRYRRPDGIVLEMSTEIVPGAQYPDSGSRAEIWLQAPTPEPITELSGLHPDAWLAELELLSPIHEIEPEESVEMKIHWKVTRS